jgi:SAM-dependent methyltransferase
MSAVTSDQERSRSFGKQAGHYDRLRPGYPAAAIHALLGERGQRVADVGAGTGKLTTSLTAAGHSVIAVEPDPAMRAAFAARLPNIDLRAGSAEALPLVDESVDAVLFGQAWHWADSEAAAREARRVLTTGGRLAMLWNVPDARASWVRRLLQLTHPGSDPLRRSDPPAVTGFCPGHLIEAHWNQRLPAHQVAELVSTWSRVSTLPTSRREALLRAVRDLMATHPDIAGASEIDLPYICAAYQYQREGV